MGKRRSLRHAIGVVALACASFGASTAAAQVDYEIMASLQFNFSNPGARSLAMAGALTGAGDDATGAWTNPGGLTNITRPEVGVEFRGFNYKTPFVDSGHFPGQAGDPDRGRIYGTSEESTHSLSFVSAVIPKSRFAFAVYRTEVANFEANISTNGIFYDDPVDGLSRAFPYDGGIDLKISNFGGSAAVRLADPISVGFGVSFYDFELDSVAFRYGAFGPGTAPGSFLGPPDRDRTPILSGGNMVSNEFISGEDSAFGVNVGASINPSDKVRFGVSFRQGPEFDINYHRDDYIELETIPEGGNGLGTFKVPDVFAAGVLVKPVPTLNITVDYRRVMYSQLTDGMETGFGGDPDDYVVEDGDEIRLAGEYLFTSLPSPLTAIAIRGGYWRDPDHRIHYAGPFSTDTVLFPEGSAEDHFTFGGGIVFEKFQFDVGFDRSELVNTFSVSGVLRF